MANVSKPAGLSPVRYLNGAAYNGQARTYYIPSTDTVAYTIGDPVDLAGSADTKGVPSVVKVTVGAGNPSIGPIVAAGEQYDVIGNINTPNSIIIPATKTRDYYVMVADDPNLLFQIQEGGTQTTPLAAANVSQNTDLASGANNGYLSGWVLDNAATTTGSTAQLKLMQLSQVSNNAFGAYAKWLVMINNHRYRPGTAGV